MLGVRPCPYPRDDAGGDGCAVPNRFLSSDDKLRRQLAAGQQRRLRREPELLQCQPSTSHSLQGLQARRGHTSQSAVSDQRPRGRRGVGCRAWRTWPLNAAMVSGADVHAPTIASMNALTTWACDGRHHTHEGTARHRSHCPRLRGRTWGALTMAACSAADRLSISSFGASVSHKQDAIAMDTAAALAAMPDTAPAEMYSFGSAARKLFIAPFLISCGRSTTPATAHCESLRAQRPNSPTRERALLIAHGHEPAGAHRAG